MVIVAAAAFFIIFLLYAMEAFDFIFTVIRRVAKIIQQTNRLNVKRQRRDGYCIKRQITCFKVELTFSPTN